MTKQCCRCNQKKSFTSFYENKRSKDGKGYACKECLIAYINPYKKSWRARNKGAEKVSQRRGKLKKAYGLTENEVDNMLVGQNGLCAICSNPIDFAAKDKKNKPHIDHNHETSFVRGLLCLTCNTGIGMFLDSPELLLKAISYLTAASQRERLNELAPLIKDDAIVRSHGNNNHERLAEMTNPSSYLTLESNK